MGQGIHRPISDNIKDLKSLITEFNQAMRNLADQITQNYLAGYPQVDAMVLSNTTITIWLPVEAYIIQTITVRVSAGTASVTPKINTTNMGVVGGVPIVATTTPVSYDITSANEAVPLDRVDILAAGLGAGAWLTVALRVRRRS